MKAEVDIGGMKYGDRELSQLIRRRMITKAERNKTKYSRKIKHKLNTYERDEHACN